MPAHPMHGKLYQWLSHNRQCGNWQSVEHETCRLTTDQAMRLCFECSFSGSVFESERKLAFAAYEQGRPWDYLLTVGVYPRVVPF